LKLNGTDQFLVYGGGGGGRHEYHRKNPEAPLESCKEVNLEMNTEKICVDVSSPECRTIIDSLKIRSLNVKTIFMKKLRIH
jgi:hypothetical protein